jgi:DNA replication and repair protein RecF
VHVTHVSLVNFRNYEQVEVALASGAVLFVGSNGQGKTNLVEAIAYAGSASSHRVSNDQALIRIGTEAAVVRLRVQHDDRAVVIEVELNRATPNRAQVNRSAVRLRDLPRYFASVIFAPEDLALVRGDPGGRRDFLDRLIVQATPRLAGVLADYERVVRQRNSLLKSARAARLSADNLSTLEVWDDRLIALGVEIIMARATLVGQMQAHVANAYSAVAGAQHLTHLGLKLSIDDPDGDESAVPLGEEPGDDSAPIEAAEGPRYVAERFRARLTALRRAELDRAVTLVGPHRDDLVLTLNALPARGFASHGESWSYALALKLASAEVLREGSATGDPVVILDDVFAELDAGRRERLADAVAHFEQVLITAAVGGDVPARLAATRIGIAAGTITDSPS